MAEDEERAAGAGGAGGAEPYPAAEIAAAWQRERPGTPTGSIEVVTPLWRLAKLFADDRARVLRAAGIDSATLDLLSVLRRSGPPYALTTREIGRRTLVTAGAVSQRVARAERQGLVRRDPDPRGRRAVLVRLTEDGHALVERSVDRVLGREAALIGGLTAEERDALVALLGKLYRDVRARVADAGTPDDRGRGQAGGVDGRDAGEGPGVAGGPEAGGGPGAGGGAGGAAGAAGPGAGQPR